MTKGYVHSYESFGSADGPGVRFVIFLSGCPMRCKYCHNPDTWDMTSGSLTTAEETVEKALHYKAYWGDKGGITVSGGEPLMQIDFVKEIFFLAKNKGINTALDTSGQPFTREEPFFSKFKELMKYTDTVLLDIKHIDSQKHKELTGHGNENILDMVGFLNQIKKPVWIRHVLVPGYTDNDEYLKKLKLFLNDMDNVERIEVLPYHDLAKDKYKKLGIDYQLKDVKPPSRERVENARRILEIGNLDT